MRSNIFLATYMYVCILNEEMSYTRDCSENSKYERLAHRPQVLFSMYLSQYKDNLKWKLDFNIFIQTLDSKPIWYLAGIFNFQVVSAQSMFTR